MTAVRERAPLLATTVRPAPRREPPFDDELALVAVPGPHEQRLPFALRAVPTPIAAQRPLPDSLPDPSRWGHSLLIGIIETAAGRRPLQQLATMLSMQVTAGLGADFERAAARNNRHWAHAATVRSVHASRPREDVAELSATLQTGRRVRAVALRLEERHGRWRCTRLQLG